ncbi:MAG: choice-of-anchor J domain-containing protein, partial [Bacteroidetes bacterium]|nr:choice-of-anchor J domain-containing protein [Bacteroidota bacterium]
WYLCVDDIRLEETPLCPYPGSLAIAGITDTEAVVSWIESGSATLWNLEYGITGFSSGSGTFAGGLTSESYSLTGLSGNTTYDVYVQADCGTDSSSWAGPVTFTTDCGILTFPVTENFDNGGAAPNCWNNEPTNDYDWTFLNTISSGGGNIAADHTGGGYFAFFYGYLAGLGDVGELTSNTIDMTGAVNPRLRFYWQRPLSGYTARLEVNIFANGTWNNDLIPDLDQQTTDWTEVTLDLTSYVYDDFRLQFRTISDNWRNIAVDDVFLEELPTDAVDWCNLQWPETINITTGNYDTVYAQAYEPGVTDSAGQGAGLEAWIGYNVNDTNPATWTNWMPAIYNVDSGNNDEYMAELGAGLPVGTYYYASRFRLNGGPYEYGGFSSGGGGFWDGVTYVSGILTVTSDPGEDCSNPVVISVTGAGTTQLTGQTNVGYGYSYDNTCLGSYDGGEDIIYELDLQVDAIVSITMDPNSTTWTGILLDDECPATSGTCLGMSTSASAQPHTISNVTLSAGTYYIMVDTYPSPDNIPDFDLTIIAVTCPPPIDLTAVNIIDVSANLSWTETGSAVSWNIEWDTTGFIQGTGNAENSVGNPFSLTGLSPETSYDYYVMSDCGGGDTSTWAGPYTFTTGDVCPAPVAVTFSNITDVSADMEWDGLYAATWDIELDTAGFTPSEIPDYDDVTVIPQALTGLIQATTYDVYIRTDCGSDSSAWTGPFQFTTLASCPEPFSLEALNITATSADLSWDGAIATVWDVEFGETGFIPTGIPTYDDVTVIPYQVTGLTPQTSYDFYVRADCGTDSSAWAGPFTFSTPCETIITFPWVEDFENGGLIPDCWSHEYVTGTTDWSFEDGDGTLTAFDGSYCARFYNTTYTDAALLITPELDLSGLTNPQLSFYHAQRVWAGDQDTLRVLYGTSPTGPWTLIPGAEWTNDIQTWTFEEFILPNPGVSYYIAFKGSEAYGYGVLVDSVVVKAGPSCPQPTMLNATAVSAGDADLSWTTGGAADWNIEWGLEGFIQGTGTFVTDVTNPYTLSGLTAGTSYDFYVQDSCGAGDVSEWTGPFTFVMPPCDPADMCYYYIDMVDDWGDGWTGNTITVYQDGLLACTFTLASGSAGNDSVLLCEGASVDLEYTTGSYPEDVGMTLTYPYGGTVYSFNPTEAPADGIFYTFTAFCTEPTCFQPTALDAQVLSDSSADLSWTTGGAADWNLEWGPAGFAQGTGTFITDASNPYSLTGLAPETSYDFYVQDSCGTGDVSLWEGPFTFTTLSSCPVPTGLGVANITGSTADLSWNGFSATLWDIEIGPASFTPTGVPTDEDVTANPYTVSGLSGNTEYEFYVRADCGTDSSDWAGPFSFTTACGIVTAFPWIEDFENGGLIPDCWSQEYVTGTTDWSFEDGDGTLTAFDGSYCARFYNTTATDATLLITPELDLSGLTNPQLSFYHAQRVWLGDQDTLRVLYGTSSTGPWTLIPGAEWTNDIQTWTFEEFLLPAPGATYYIAFKGSEAYGHGVLVDSVVVRDAGSCLPPTGLTATYVTDTSATISWTTGGASNWNLEYGPAGFSQGTGTLINDVTNPFTITGLSTETTYDVYVLDSCGAGELSDWAGPLVFTTSGTPLPNPTACEIGIDIPDADCISVPVSVSTTGSALGVDLILTDVNFIIEHPWDGDVDITLESPSGISIVLTDDNGGSSADYGIIDGSCTQYTDLNMAGADGNITAGIAPFVGSYIPEGNFADFNDGSNPNGTWYLNICDDASGDIGTLEYLELVFDSTITDIAIAEPQPGNWVACNMSANDTIEVVITNTGSVVIPSGETIVAQYQINAGATVTDTILLTGDLNPGDSLYHAFGTTYDFSALGIYDWTFTISYLYDIYAANNVVSGSVEHIVLTVEINAPDTVQTDPASLPVSLGTVDIYDSYFWTDQTGTYTGTGQVFDAPDFGWYYVWVTLDSSGCEAVDSVFIEEIQQLTVDLAALPDYAYYELCDIGLQPVRIYIMNEGINPVSAGETIYTWYQINGGAIVEDSLILLSDLYPSEDTMKIMTPYDFSALGTYWVDFGIVYAGDLDTSNNAGVYEIEHVEYLIDLDVLNGGINDTLVVTSYPVTLDAGAGYETYYWSTGDTTQTTEVSSDGVYFAAISNDFDCYAWDSIFVIYYTSITGGFAVTGISVFPNPSRDVFNVTVRMTSETNVSFELMDMQGRIIYTRRIENVSTCIEKIDVRNFAKGVYYLKVKTGSEVNVGKVVIQ